MVTQGVMNMTRHVTAVTDYTNPTEKKRRRRRKKLCFSASDSVMV